MIRVATAADLPALVALESAAFGADAWSEQAVREELGEGRRALVAEDASGVAGYAVSRIAGDVVDLERIAVRPDARRQGTATALLGDLLAHTGAADRMLLEVSSANRAALEFYVRQGFSQIDLRPRYYRDGSDALVLRRALTRGCGGGES